jgi:Rod binding domain-containing protein
MDGIQSTAASPAQSRQLLDEKGKVKLKRAVQEFEALMLSTMLKSMRSGIPKSDMFGDSYGGDMLEGMFDVELARHMSRSSSLGMGEMLYKEITGEELPRLVLPAGAGVPLKTGLPAIPAGTGVPHQTGFPAISAGTGVTSAVTPAADTPKEVPALSRAASPVQPPNSVQAVPDTVRRRVDTLGPIVREAAEKHGVNENLLKAVIAAESAGRPNARSSKDAKGVMQLIDTTAAMMGVRNVWDPRDNINGGARYLGQMMGRFKGDIQRAVASYNAGPGAVEKHGGVPPYPETQRYVSKVMDYLRYYEQQEPGENDED